MSQAIPFLTNGEIWAGLMGVVTFDGDVESDALESTVAEAAALSWKAGGTSAAAHLKITAASTIAQSVNQKLWRHIGLLLAFQVA
jgi:hypothetical protein